MCNSQQKKMSIINLMTQKSSNEFMVAQSNHGSHKYVAPVSENYKSKAKNGKKLKES